MLLSAILLNPLVLPAQAQDKMPTSTPPNTEQVVEFINHILEPPREERIEDITGPMVEAAKAARRRAVAAERARLATLAAQAPLTPVPAPQALIPPQNGSLVAGTRGYALPYGNCVNQVPPALRGYGNPINWSVTTQTPYIGAAALWYFNHTGRVVGIWSNGDLEIAHENAGEWGQTRFPRSTFRGFR